MTDEEGSELSDRERLEALAAAPLRKLRTVIAKRRRLIANLEGDLERHGEADLWKRYGDLLLANIQTARRVGDLITVTDYFDEAAPQIEIPGEHNLTLTEVAEGYFRRYAKSRNAGDIVAGRIETAERETADAQKQVAEIEAAIESGDEALIASLVEQRPKPKPVGRKKKAEAAFKGQDVLCHPTDSRYLSGEGLQITIS